MERGLTDEQLMSTKLTIMDLSPSVAGYRRTIEYPLILLVIISLLLVPITSSAQSRTVRLVGGTHFTEGRVEVNINGQWGTICDDDFDDKDAMVLCRSLGHSPLQAKFLQHRFGAGACKQKIWLRRLECTGTEPSFAACRNYRDTDKCNHDEDVSISCGLPAAIRYPPVAKYVTSSSLQLEWRKWQPSDGGLGHIRSYIVEYRLAAKNNTWSRAGTDATLPSSSSGGNCIANVSNLTFNTEYSFRVKSLVEYKNKDMTGLGPETISPVKTTCGVPSMPVILLAFATSDNEGRVKNVHLAWQMDPNGHHCNFWKQQQIVYSVSATLDRPWRHMISSQHVRNATMHVIAPSAEPYYLQINVINDAGISSESIPYRVGSEDVSRIARSSLQKHGTTPATWLTFGVPLAVVCIILVLLLIYVIVLRRRLMQTREAATGLSLAHRSEQPLPLEGIRQANPGDALATKPSQYDNFKATVESYDEVRYSYGTDTKNQNNVYEYMDPLEYGNAATMMKQGNQSRV